MDIKAHILKSVQENGPIIFELVIVLLIINKKKYFEIDLYNFFLIASNGTNKLCAWRYTLIRKSYSAA